MDVITAHVKTELIDSTASDVEVAHFLGILETALGECYAQLEKEIARFETSLARMGKLSLSNPAIPESFPKKYI